FFQMYLPNWMTIEKDRLPEYALAGQKIFTTEMIKTGEKRFGTIHKRNDGKAMLNLLQIVFFQTKKWSKQLLKIVEKIKKLENSEVEKFDEKLQKIENLRKYLGILIECHSGISMFSSFTYVLVAIFVRGKSEGDLTTEELADISTIFAENSLKPISAEVPKMMKNLAKLIFKNQHLEKFLNFDETKKAMEFLMELDDSTGELARKFMEIHGHRGIDELSLQGETWKNDPKQIILNLKGILESMEKNDEALENELEENSGNVIDHLKHVQVQGLKRRIFQFFINQAHWGVYLRESAKSDVVYGNVALRNSCLDLGEFLHNQGYLPTSRSILHLTMIEIRELFETRNPRILHRMRRREKILEKQNENQYDFIHFGHPIPKDMTRFKNMKSEVELRGTAVCEGTIIGKARVAKTLNEAFETKPGEILITKYTDIGWSPLFPMIKGLVTEIGGLLSHGSVVAREYGLPCVIAVEGATDVFKTGDQIVLDGSKVVAREYGLPCVIAVEGATDVFKTGDQIVLDGSKGTVKRILLTESENSTTNAK
uniref:PEP-utilising enzyme mobile domain-containing protein n=1 Tax=Panagrolaimus sp. JU765 TaxID=591449 RepID=A0AC34R2N5_9BILA